MSNKSNTQAAGLTLGPAISIEEQRREFAQRNPVNKNFWEKMSDLTILQATLYTFDIDPGAIQKEFNAYAEPVSTDELPEEFSNRLSIVKSAVRAGLIKRVAVAGNHSSDVDDDTRILQKSFSKWCVKNDYTRESEDKTLDIAQQPHAANGCESTHDPVPLNGLAKMFRLTQDEAVDKETWRKFAHNAQRNGLSDARTQKGSGKAQSRFDPVKVGGWLVNKGKLTQEKVDHVLAKNLPERSKHLKDFFAP